MRSKILFLVFLWSMILLPSTFSHVMAEPLGPDLDITPGVSGEWQSDGYYFGGTAYANKTGFKPFHALDAVTIVIWIVTPANEGFEILVTQRVDSTHNCRVYLTNTFDITAQIANGSAVTAIASVTYSLDTLTFIVMRWDKDDNSGKVDLFVDSSSTLYKRVSTEGLTSIISANLDLKVGTSTTPATGDFSGIFRHLAIYRTKLSNATISSIYSAGSDAYDSSAWHLWMMNEGSGPLFTQGPNIWDTTQETGFDFEVLFPPFWHGTQSTLFTVVLPVFVGSINALVALLGLIMIPSSTVYLAKNRSDMDMDKLFIFLFLFFMGWALLVGGLVG